MSLPSQEILSTIRQRILKIPNHRKESKRREHYCLFLLGYGSGLRVSEAVNFDLSAKTRKGLYRLAPTKKRKERLVYIPRKVIRELKKCEWKPNNTNRFNFYHFLKKIKRELDLPANTELTPHTLRRAFATYHAENGLPLPLLSKMLGHQSVRTTALYWMNTYHGSDDDDSNDLLAGKVWLEKPKKPQLESENSAKVNLDELPEVLADKLPPFSPLPNYLSKINQLEQQLTQIQQENNSLKSELAQARKQNADLQQDLNNLSEQNVTLCQEKAKLFTQRRQSQRELTEKDQVIRHLEQKLASEQQKRLATENNLSQEKLNNQSSREINANLTQKIHAYEQNHTNLLNAYQKAIKDKQTAEKRADNYEQQLTQLTTEIKNLAKTLAQWQKLNYYQQLEQEKNNMEAKIIHPPPWKKI